MRLPVFGLLAPSLAGILIWTAGCSAPPFSARGAGAERRTENLVLVTLDGLRWQELFGGADGRLMNDEQGVEDVRRLRRPFWRADAGVRRELLMPFFWEVVARQGQVFGDATVGSSAVVTNGHNFSYPGYQEILAGFPDARIDSNARRPNPNVTVLEWLHRRPGFAGRVAVFGTWDVFPAIVHETRSEIPVNAGWEPLAPLLPGSERMADLDALAADLPHYWGGERWDALTAAGALEYVRTRRPRVLYVALGETDSWAHARRYDLYLNAAHGADRFLGELWSTLQSMPQYAGRTTLVLTTDHGRGDTGEDWTDHGADVVGCERIWSAVLGPDTPALGVRSGVDVTQAQTAATLAALLGLRAEWARAEPRAAPPLPGITGGSEWQDE